MNEKDEKIRQAANALAEALTEGGKDYWVRSESLDVTRMESTGREFVYVIHVEEHASRVIAP